MLAGLTRVSETTVRAYFWKWIDIGFTKLRFLVSWPDKEALLETLPADFKVRYPRLTLIIDCFEILIVQPSNLKARAQVYSHYKKHPTVKFALVCTPLGAISLSHVHGVDVFRMLSQASFHLYYTIPETKFLRTGASPCKMISPSFVQRT